MFNLFIVLLRVLKWGSGGWDDISLFVCSFFSSSFFLNRSVAPLGFICDVFSFRITYFHSGSVRWIRIFSGSLLGATPTPNLVPADSCRQMRLNDVNHPRITNHNFWLLRWSAHQRLSGRVKAHLLRLWWNSPTSCVWLATLTVWLDEVLCRRPNSIDFINGVQLFYSYQKRHIFAYAWPNLRSSRLMLCK